MEKVINSRIALRYATEEEWREDEDYIPRKGELCFCETGDNPLPKVGNGVDAYKDLSWLKAEHGDIQLYFGASFDPPTDLSGMTRVPGIIKQDLIEQDKKIIKNIHVDIDPVEEMGQYPAMAIDKRFKLVAWKHAEAPELPTNSFVTVDKGDYTLYYLTSPVMADIDYLFVFEIGG